MHQLCTDATADASLELITIGNGMLGNSSSQGGLAPSVLAAMLKPAQ